MQRTQSSDSFKVFPYRKEYANGRTNNGGIDLVREPWRISEITEAEDFPALLKLIEEFNNPNALFLTLGCEAGMRNNVMYGYVEFTFRSGELANDLSLISELDEFFYTWAGAKNAQLEEALRSVLWWEYDSFSYQGSAERNKIAVFFQAPDKDYAGRILDTIRVYFCDVFKPPS